MKIVLLTDKIMIRMTLLKNAEKREILKVQFL